MPIRLTAGATFPVPVEHTGNANHERSQRGGDIEQWQGLVVPMCKQKNGSQFLQSKIDEGPHEVRECIYKEIVAGPTADIVKDQFGNYVVQKLLKKGTKAQIKGLGAIVTKEAKCLAVHMYGCRVLQCSLEVLEQEDKTKVIHELSSCILQTVKDQHGNHVVQKCVEEIPEATDIVADCLRGVLVKISKHIYGCRIVERILADYQLRDEKDGKVQSIMAELFSRLDELVENQFGNYVVQYILATAHPQYAQVVVDKVRENLLRYSLHKYASNVVERCFDTVSTETRKQMLLCLMNTSAPQTPLTPAFLAMAADQFGNYVVQKIAEKSDDNSLDMILRFLRNRLSDLVRTSYGKVVVQRVVKISDERERDVPKELVAVAALRRDAEAPAQSGGGSRYALQAAGSEEPKPERGGMGSNLVRGASEKQQQPPPSAHPARAAAAEESFQRAHHHHHHHIQQQQQQQQQQQSDFVAQLHHHHLHHLRGAPQQYYAQHQPFQHHPQMHGGLPQKHMMPGLPPPPMHLIHHHHHHHHHPWVMQPWNAPHPPPPPQPAAAPLQPAADTSAHCPPPPALLESRSAPLSVPANQQQAPPDAPDAPQLFAAQRPADACGEAAGRPPAKPGHSVMPPLIPAHEEDDDEADLLSAAVNQRTRNAPEPGAEAGDLFTDVDWSFTHARSGVLKAEAAWLRPGDEWQHSASSSRRGSATAASSVKPSVVSSHGLILFEGVVFSVNDCRVGEMRENVCAELRLPLESVLVFDASNQHRLANSLPLSSAGGFTLQAGTAVSTFILPTSSGTPPHVLRN